MRKLENTWTCNFRLRKVVKIYNQHDFWQVQTLIIWKFCPLFLIKMRLEGSTVKSVFFLLFYAGNFYCCMLETWKMMKIQFYVTKGSQSGWNTCRNDMRHIFSDFSSTSHKKAWTCFGGSFSWFCCSCEGVCLSAPYTEISNLKNVVFGYKKGWKGVKYIPKCHQSYFKTFLLNIS